MVKERKKANSHARIMTRSSQVMFLTIKVRETIRAATKTVARTRVAVVTAKTAGPRSGMPPSSVEAESDMSRSELEETWTRHSSKGERVRLRLRSSSRFEWIC
jgi:hypothetical protein